VHIGALLQEGWFLWETIRAETIGQHRYIIWTPTALERHGTAGPAAVKIQTMGFECNEEQIGQVFEKLRKVMAQKKFATDEEFETVVHEVLGK
jgi:isopropylmalate/homocitrate/citramalate synthase